MTLNKRKYFFPFSPPKTQNTSLYLLFLFVIFIETFYRKSAESRKTRNYYSDLGVLPRERYGVGRIIA
jgi:hypothetical protein